MAPWQAPLVRAMKTIVGLGSQVVLKLVERLPIIIKLCAALLAFTAAKMIVSEPLLNPMFDPPQWLNTVARWATYAVALAGVLGAGYWAARKNKSATTNAV